MPSIQSCHLSSLVEILSVSDQATGTFSFLAPPKAHSDLRPPICGICHLFILVIYYFFLVTSIALAIYALCLPQGTGC